MTRKMISLLNLARNDYRQFIEDIPKTPENEENIRLLEKIEEAIAQAVDIVKEHSDKEKARERTEGCHEQTIRQLEDLYAHVDDMSRDGEEIWEKDKKALKEAISLIADYERGNIYEKENCSIRSN